MILDMHEAVPWHQSASGLWLHGEESPPPRPQALDLFAGAGGFSLGMEDGGLDVVAAAEWDRHAAATYLLNLGRPDVVVVADSEAKAERLRAISGTNEARHGPGSCRWFWARDIHGLTGDIVREAVGEIAVLFGSPPCQGMSRARGKVRNDDPRNDMTFEFARLVEELLPAVFVMENVPQLLTIRGGALYAAFEERLAAAGYTVCANVVDACDYGVPQHRTRAIVTGSLGERPLAMPMPTHWPRIRRPNGTSSYIRDERVPGPGGGRGDNGAARAPQMKLGI